MIRTRILPVPMAVDPPSPYLPTHMRSHFSSLDYLPIHVCVDLASIIPELQYFLWHPSHPVSSLAVFSLSSHLICLVYPTRIIID